MRADLNDMASLSKLRETCYRSFSFCFSFCCFFTFSFFLVYKEIVLSGEFYSTKHMDVRFQRLANLLQSL
jgi:hypothetical protein